MAYMAVSTNCKSISLGVHHLGFCIRVSVFFGSSQVGLNIDYQDQFEVDVEVYDTIATSAADVRKLPFRCI